MNVGTEGHQDIGNTDKVYLPSFPCFFNFKLDEETIEHLNKKLEDIHAKDMKIFMGARCRGKSVVTERGSGMSYNGLCPEHIWIDEQLALEEEPVIILKQTPFWANDWRKKHKRK